MSMRVALTVVAPALRRTAEVLLEADPGTPVADIAAELASFIGGDAMERQHGPGYGDSRPGARVLRFPGPGSRGSLALSSPLPGAEPRSVPLYINRRQVLPQLSLAEARIMDGAVVSLGDPDGNTYDKKHRLIDCASVLRAIIAVEPNGHYTVLADHYQGKKFNSPNDVVLGPDGALYFTDPTLDLVKGEKQELPYQGVFRLGTDGSVRLLIQDLTQPNGLAFAPDGKKLYVDDSERKDIHVYDVGRDGSVSNARLFGKLDGPGDPDGMRVDVNGNLYVTGESGIWVWDAQGHHLGTIVLPEQTANLTWGDADLKTLYITSSTSVLKLRTKVPGFVPY